MPNEILSRICGFVEYSANDVAEAQNEVKSLRLTCRRFCTASSHLLLQLAHVEMNPSSLSHFEEISHHKAIRVGIREVRVDSRFYDSVLANDFRAFAVEQVSMLYKQMENWASTGSQPHDLSSGNISEETILNAVDRSREIWRAWYGVLQDDSEDPVNGEYLKYRHLLRKCHQEYRRRFAAQETLGRDGLFIQAIAPAVARIPTATRLKVYDGGQVERFDSKAAPFWEQMNNDAALIEDNYWSTPDRSTPADHYIQRWTDKNLFRDEGPVQFDVSVETTVGM